MIVVTKKNIRYSTNRINDSSDDEVARAAANKK
jgi:hypothetical protein